MPIRDEVTVCPEHLRFIPCRRCEPGQEKLSTDPEDVRRIQEFQWGANHDVGAGRRFADAWRRLSRPPTEVDDADS